MVCQVLNLHTLFSKLVLGKFTIDDEMLQLPEFYLFIYFL